MASQRRNAMKQNDLEEMKMTAEQATREIYKPSAEVVAGANVKNYQELALDASEDLAGFWAEQARQFVWFEE